MLELAQKGFRECLMLAYQSPVHTLMKLEHKGLGECLKLADGLPVNVFFVITNKLFCKLDVPALTMPKQHFGKVFIKLLGTF
jgi:hypothetical protein